MRTFVIYLEGGDPVRIQPATTEHADGLLEALQRAGEKATPADEQEWVHWRGVHSGGIRLDRIIAYYEIEATA